MVKLRVALCTDNVGKNIYSTSLNVNISVIAIANICFVIKDVIGILYSA